MTAPTGALIRTLRGSRKVLVAETFEARGVRVPFGFVSDGASIPWALRPIVGSPMAPEVLDAAIVHDWLYYSSDTTTRRDADALFYSMLREDCYVGWLRARLMWLAVRLCGWLFW